MKATFLSVAAVLALGAGFSEAQARGQNVSLSPAETALLPDDHSGETHVVLRFDLSSLPNGAARVFTRANLEWTVSGLTEESECNIYAFPVTGSGGRPLSCSL